DFDFAAVEEARANQIGRGVAVERGDEETPRVLLDRSGALGADHYFDGFGLGEERADLPAGLAALAAHAVRAQDAKGVAMVAANDGFNFFHCHESLIKYGRFPAAIAQGRAAFAPGRLGRAGDAARAGPGDARGRVPRALSLRRFRRLSAGLRRGRKAAADARGLRADYAPAARAAGGAERELRRDHCGGGRGAVEGAGVRADLRCRARGRGGVAGGSALD